MSLAPIDPFILPHCSKNYQQIGETTLLPLGVEVFFQIFGSNLRGHAVRWHVGFGDPQEGVQKQLTEIVVAPVAVEVASGKTETAAAVWPFDGPGDVLG